MNTRAHAVAKGICPVHHVKMERKWAPVVYGAIVPWVPDSIRRSEFPYAREFVAGGCVVYGTRPGKKYQNPQPTKAYLHICLRCKVAQQAWLDAHPDIAEKVKKAEKDTGLEYYRSSDEYLRL